MFSRHNHPEGECDGSCVENLRSVLQKAYERATEHPEETAWFADACEVWPPAFAMFEVARRKNIPHYAVALGILVGLALAEQGESLAHIESLAIGKEAKLQ